MLAIFSSCFFNFSYLKSYIDTMKSNIDTDKRYYQDFLHIILLENKGKSDWKSDWKSNMKYSKS